MLANSNVPKVRPVPEVIRRFVKDLRRLEYGRAEAPAVTQRVLQFFALPGIDHQKLAPTALSLIRFDPTVQSWLEAHRAGASPICDANLLQALDVPLVHALLRNAIVCDLQLETLLTAARRALLSRSCQETGEGIQVYDLAVSLACQCFFTEFVWATSPTEDRDVENLTVRLTGWLERATNTLADPTEAIAVCGMYRPLWKLDPNRRLLELAREPGTNQDLSPPLAIQVANHWEEMAILETIPVLRLSEDTVSRDVRQQYEDSPCPIWRSMWVQEPRPLLEVVRSYCPLVEMVPEAKDHVDMLVAGCGTERHPLLEATRYQDVRILAVDLSRRSLAFAIRMARQLGIDNVEFAQADILALNNLDRDFHVIDACGVLHHMADPAAALSILTRLLKPAGFLWLAKYHREAHRDVIRVKEQLRSSNRFDTSDIRKARQEVIRLLAPADPLAGEGSPLFTASEFRDMFLPTHAVESTLAELASMAWKANLRLAGLYDFQPAAEAAFLTRFSTLSALNDLNNLIAFDREFPNPTRHGMYQLLLQKPADPA